MTTPSRPGARDAYTYRSDPLVPPFPDDRPILVFDGVCVLCSGFARFLLRHDSRGQFRLLAAQTPLGTALYRHFGLDPVAYETNLLIDDGQIWFKSEGSIRIFERLGFPWSLVTLARLLPRAVRDRLYDVVARNRYRWFGVRQTCYMPERSEADRFLA